MIAKVELNVNDEAPVTLKVNEIVTSGGNSVSTNDYSKLDNKPSIEGVILQGNRTFNQLGMKAMSTTDIEKILYLD